MIIVKLQGGLGNQMFQYATARGIKNEDIILDNYFLKNNTQASGTFTPRKYGLSAFKLLRAKIATDTFSKTLNGKKGIYKYLKWGAFKFISYLKHEDDSIFIDLSKIKTPNIYLDGYFQDENYFIHIREQILADFTFPAVSYENIAIEKEIRKSDNPVSIQIRRGDFLKPALLVFNGLLPIAYYKQAIKIIESKTSDQRYFIFSDDPEWCQSAFKFLGERAILASGNAVEEWEDMYLMSLCKHNIVANSSYSWWGAWLNNHPDKIVITPEKWFYDIKTNIIPTRWIKL
jgi:hypothetical protein